MTRTTPRLSAPQRRALTTIHQAPPLGVKVVDYWGGGWCRIRVTVPQGAPPITPQTYSWLLAKRLIQEGHHSQRPSSGLERNRRYATLTPAGRIALGVPGADDFDPAKTYVTVGDWCVSGTGGPDGYVLRVYTVHPEAPNDMGGHGMVRHHPEHSRLRFPDWTSAQRHAYLHGFLEEFVRRPHA